MKVIKKSSVLFGLVLGILFLFTQGAWAVEVLYAPFEDYYLVLYQTNLIPHTTVYVVGDMPPNPPPPPLQPWACSYINGQQTSLMLGKVDVRLGARQVPGKNFSLQVLSIINLCKSV